MDAILGSLFPGAGMIEVPDDYEPPASDDDAALMRRYRQGDSTAFRRLYERHRLPLHRYLLRLAGDPTAAEEVFQEVWIAVIRGRERYAERESFGSYLYSIAHRRCSDYWRRRYREPRDQVRNEELEVLALTPDADAAPLPDAVAQDAQLNDALLKAVDRLPPVQREAFLLRADACLGIDEIAKVTGVTRETAKSRLRYATVKLREMLGEWR